ncbi:MAG: helix-turn-helix transcriptional regulator [Gemmatimonadetes bacterium]|nr:helix-turn-helix transcriptional regulator [Gemmatimonadota bacterium]NNK64426.1 helix-turn-helix transcriptional regulator [Gemmatimonadota bacterium]
MTPTNAHPEPPALPSGLLFAIVVLTLVAVLVGTDLILDGRSGAEPLHLVLEGALMVLSAGAAARLWWHLRRARRSVVLLERDVGHARAEAARWRDETSELLDGLGASIARQFDRWTLTNAERSVALLLLKGLSHREVARVRQTSERTVRQQARNVYRKAGLTGRSELSAFFLEDLLLPPTGLLGEEGPASPSSP